MRVRLHQLPQGKDILDVWFDSGSTWAAVAAKRPELGYPADLYLEGGDQYRGWFQSSMLTSIAVNGVAPYKQIITHGWTVDGQGKVMHKSLGNAISPQDTIQQYGADIFRLWVSSADYTQDMRLSKDILKQLADAYLKIRNTCRYILGNLEGFDPDDQVAYGDMMELDQWAVTRCNDLVAECRRHYDGYEFHSVYRAIYNFCVIDMSNFYLDIIKDRLYCEAPGSFPGRAPRAPSTASWTPWCGCWPRCWPSPARRSGPPCPTPRATTPRACLFQPHARGRPALAFTPEQSAYWADILALKDDVNKALRRSGPPRPSRSPPTPSSPLYLDDSAWGAVPEAAGPPLRGPVHRQPGGGCPRRPTRAIRERPSPA